MVISSLFVTGTLVVSLIGIAPGSQATRATTGAVRVAIAADPFSPPPKKKPKRPASPARPTGSAPAAEDDTEEEAPPPRRPPPKRRPAASEESEEDESAASADEDEEEKPRVKRKRRRVVEEEEEEDDEEEDAPMASLPVIIPRLISFGGGVSAIGRSFGYNTALQKESTFPRMGINLALEAYPMLRLPRGWYKRLGVAFNLNMEFGAAALQLPMMPASSWPVSQRRWAFDVRYAIPLGERVVVLPALGIGGNTFDLKSSAPTSPTNCGSSATTPCIADIQTMFFAADLNLRVAVMDQLSLSLSGGYILGLAVGKANGQIGQDSTSTKLSGFHVEPGANLMLMDWLAVRAAIPFVHYGYAFTSPTATYKTATETYYGIMGSVVLFTR
jgi:hypothetical protein